jgi:hypothetical protein
MKTCIKLAILLFFAGSITVLPAQKMSSVAIKTSLSGAFKPNYKLALEWKPGYRSSIECSVGYQRYNTLASDAFNGIQITEYAKRRSFYTQHGDNQPLGDSGWDYFGDGRPNNNPEEAALVPLSTLRLNIGYRRFYQMRKKGMQIFVQPAFSAVMFDAYEISQEQVTMVKKTEETWLVSAQSIEKQTVIQTQYFEQSQRMERKRSWYGGPAALIGWGLQFPKGFLVEARCNVGINLGTTYKDDLKTIQELAPLYGQLEIMVGYRLGNAML